MPHNRGREGETARGLGLDVRIGLPRSPRLPSPALGGQPISQAGTRCAEHEKHRCLRGIAIPLVNWSEPKAAGGLGAFAQIQVN